MTGSALTGTVSLQQTGHNNVEVYPDRAAASCPLQGNGQREIVSPAPTLEIQAYLSGSQQTTVPNSQVQDTTETDLGVLPQCRPPHFATHGQRLTPYCLPGDH